MLQNQTRPLVCEASPGENICVSIILSAIRFYLTERVYKVVLLNSIPAQIRHFNLDMSITKWHLNEFAGKLPLARRLNTFCEMSLSPPQVNMELREEALRAFEELMTAYAYRCHYACLLDVGAEVDIYIHIYT